MRRARSQGDDRDVAASLLEGARRGIQPQQAQVDDLLRDMAVVDACARGRMNVSLNRSDRPHVSRRGAAPCST